MTTAQITGITPPPSIEDVLGVISEDTRIGQVDFSARLAPEAAEEPAATHRVVDELLDTPAPTVADIFGEVDGDELVADAPDAVEVRRAPVVEADADADADADGLTAATLAPKQTARARRLLGWRAQQPGAHGATTAPVPAPRPTRSMVPPPAEILDRVVEEPVDAPEVAVLRRGGAAAPARPDVADLVAAELSASVVTAPVTLTAPVTAPPVRQSLRLVDERPPTVEELARLVVERLHDAELAMMRHLEAMEVEADRRVELATAQAELDADLIRLQARREAHEILAAARRAAGHQVEEPAGRAVSEVTEALGRFADVMDELRPTRYRTMP